MATGFLFGGNTGETAESLARKRAVAEALLANANSSVPQTIGDGIASIGQALSGRLGLNALNKKEAAGRSAVSDRIRQALSGYGAGGSSASASSGIPMTDAATEITAGKPIDMTTNQVYSDFINTVKSGVDGAPGITNPYGLAAVAATGNAESGFSPGNVNRTWSDPSQSGQPGTAGGIMSWRGPRYEALAATGDLSPSGQGKFFLQENPQLIAALNNAKSLEEAQGLMNSAWAFAGHNEPGGAEVRRRMGFASSYLPSFQGGGTEVASLDPKAGATSPQAAIQAVAPASGYIDPQVTTASRGTPAPTPVPRRNQQVAQALTAPAPSAGPLGVNPELFDVLNDPYISQGQSAVVRALIDNGLREQQAARERAAKQADPAYRLGLEKSQLEVDALKNPKISPADQARIDLEKNKPTEVGGRLVGPDGKVIYEAPGKWVKLDDGSLFNESTGEFKVAPKPEGQSGFRFKGSSVEAQALNGLMDSGTLTEDQAQQLGAGKTVSGPNGEIIFMTPQGVFSGNPKEGTAKPLQPQAQPAEQQQPYVDLFGNGGVTPTPSAPTPPPAPAPEAAEPPQRPGMIPLTAPKVTIDESKAAGFADRMNEAEAIIQKYGAAGANVKDQFVSDNDYIPNVAENWLLSNDFQNFGQARRNFINAQLRRESGAVIGPTEFENARKQYFPEPGDNDEVLKQKAQNRKTAIDAMVRDAGPTYGKKKSDEPAPDFSKMSMEELDRYINGR
ncbi:hypothetical protein [Rhizobium sp. BK661]|uniref:hypothetical protein n=1 Tax=Rhizobium sp. BK661 TaxID=2586991 RepID=UPI0021679BC8|nr:hypothetical protein [Rhizobium sp. BK661]MCS3741994.1 hypothetical protein [Rhizobium sp. BK661]